MRPNIDDYFLTIAMAVARRSTCMRRSVGCVLVDEKNRILATGYNGMASGQPHCNEVRPDPHGYAMYHPHACPGAFAQSGEHIDQCGAIHAEQNALVQCRDVDAIRTCYTTTQPCVSCLKLLLGTPCDRIVYRYAYVAMDEPTQRLWLSAGRTMTWAPYTLAEGAKRG
jgi:dCMP deaminase